ncbi:adenosylmethionine carrier 1, chloroplastic/mitochondrial [Seminavis robusta]|uniref:Adenosylmethionine carrier 1, chloroplastic/mitochondrial n=1 Tax=Seminavis robusta TaxID=568900 RepID=A0A9N8HN32_9STRA|nr:adenosylmethionine carrier 1, chloroplastic/mitochondrial [Seminavis robusta]|eukprot:Sro1175_g249160.1 adenosylmethionine carrier 1, chloroplastic/mitochondrial (354) ;mRNA; f:15743-16905
MLHYPSLWLFLVCLCLFTTPWLVHASTAASSSNNAISKIGRGGAKRHAKGPMATFVQTVMDARRHLVAAAVARSTSIFAMYPVDTIKTRIQMDQPNPFRLQGMYKGVDGSLLGQVPYGVLTFGSYEVYKNALLERFPNTRPIFLYALSAILGDLTGSGILCPSEVIKQQMQAGMYSSTTEAFTQIVKTKGIGGLYQGYLGGLTRDVPFRVAQLTTYEVTKNAYLKFKHFKLQQQSSTKTSKSTSSASSLELSPVEAALCGAVAGTFSAGITAPLDRIKTLLMTDSNAYGGTVASCAAKIWREEGIPGFATGVVPRVTYIAPSVVIFFIAYEQVQQRLKHRWTTTPTVAGTRKK